MDDKVEYYINKIYEFRYYYGRPFEHKKNELTGIKKIINRIISQNDDYLFTDNFLDYLSSFPNFDYDLAKLSSHIYGKLDVFRWYFEALDQNIIEDVKPHYYLSLDDNLKQIVYDVHNCIETIYQNGIHSDLGCKMVLYIVSYCHINNRLDKVNEICNSLLNDYGRLIDDTSLNDITDGSYAWIDRIIGFCEEHIQSKRSIK